MSLTAPSTAEVSELLSRLNADLPALDWKAGARSYVADFFARHSREQIAHFIRTKPLGEITPEAPLASLTEAVSYLNNFANTIALLKLERGRRVLDVACGGGWVSHWMRKLGYDTLGVDISPDFVDLARERLTRDPDLGISSAAAEAAFRAHDLEEAPLPLELDGAFDAAILESCLHHFFDPVAALHHVVRALKPDGVVLIIEGENRTGPIRPEYMAVMRETHTLERPYPRTQLLQVLTAAGLPHAVFLAQVNGYFPQGAEAGVAAIAAEAGAGQNLCLCARTAEAVRAVVPSYTPLRDVAPIVLAPEPPPAVDPPPATPLTAAVAFATAVKLAAPAWAQRPLAAVWRRMRS